MAPTYSYADPPRIIDAVEARHDISGVALPEIKV